MDVKEAVARAKSYIHQVFDDEKVSQIRLEEVEFDEVERAWLVTIGFSRPVQRLVGVPATLQNIIADRSYKTVRIADDGAGIPSVKIRQIHGAD